MKTLGKTEEKSTDDVWWMQDCSLPVVSNKLSHAGLSSIEASDRLQQYGPNRLTDSHAISAWVKFFTHF